MSWSRGGSGSPTGSLGGIRTHPCSSSWSLLYIIPSDPHPLDTRPK